VRLAKIEEITLSKNNSAAKNSHSLLLKALMLTGVILFGFFLIEERGLLSLTLTSDRSYISAIILMLYAAFSIHWLYLIYGISSAQKSLDESQPLLDEVEPDGLSIKEGAVYVHKHRLEPGIFSDYLQDLLKKSRYPSREIDHGILLEALVERLMAKHSFGHFATDILLKFGLLGTVIGFIMMLSPVGSMTDFDPSVLQQLLGQMSGGMAIALYTTATGLVTSALLGLQYQLLDSATAHFVDRVAITVEVSIMPLLAQKSAGQNDAPRGAVA